MEDHEYSPIDKDENGDVLVKMIETPRIMSGTKAREAALNMDFEDFYMNVAPKDSSVNTKEQYKNVYEKIRDASAIEEISTSANVGGYAGPAFGNMSRDNKKEAKRSKLNLLL